MVCTNLDFSAPQAWAFHAAQAVSETAALQDFKSAVKRLGFANVALLHDVPPNAKLTEIREIAGYIVHPEVHLRFENNRPMSMVARCIDRGSCETIDVAKAKMTTPPNQRTCQLELILDAGVTSCLFIGTRDRHTNLTTMFTAEFHDAPDEFARLVRSVSKRLHIALTYFREGLCVNNLQQRTSQPVLHTRERECLAWVAAGKTTSEIGDLTNLADSTVNDYIASSCKKLGASHRAQAAARAMLLTEAL